MRRFLPSLLTLLLLAPALSGCADEFATDAATANALDDGCQFVINGPDLVHVDATDTFFVSSMDDNCPAPTSRRWRVEGNGTRVGSVTASQFSVLAGSGPGTYTVRVRFPKGDGTNIHLLKTVQAIEVQGLTVTTSASSPTGIDIQWAFDIGSAMPQGVGPTTAEIVRLYADPQTAPSNPPANPAAQQGNQAKDGAYDLDPNGVLIAYEVTIRDGSGLVIATGTSAFVAAELLV